MWGVHNLQLIWEQKSWKEPPTTHLVWVEIHWAKEKHKKKTKLPFSCLDKTKTQHHTSQNKRFCSDFTTPLLPHLFQQIFILKTSSPPQKKPHLGFQRFLIFLSVRYYCISLPLESFIWDYTHVPQHSCSTSWLLSFFFPREKPASIRHPISCSLSKGCSGLSSAWKLDSSERVSWKLWLGSFPVAVFQSPKIK